MKNFLYILFGAVAMFIVLKVVTSGKKPVAPEQSKQDFKNLIATQEAENLIKSPEFRAVLLTPEFRKLIKNIADGYLTELTKTI